MLIKIVVSALEFIADMYELYKNVKSGPPAPVPQKCPSCNTTITPVPVTPQPSPVTAKQGFSKSLDDCHKSIQAAFPLVKNEFMAAYPGCDLLVDFTWRGPELQHALFEKGRKLDGQKWVLVDPKAKVTDDDGTILKSHHNTYPSQAADIYIVRGGKTIPAESKEGGPMYVALGKLWEAQGLVSGATWKFNWKDPDHVQVSYKIV